MATRTPRCTFGKTVEKRLIDLDKKQRWLIEEVRKDTGMYMDTSYLTRIETGRTHPFKMIASMCKVLDLPLPTIDELQIL